MYSKSGDATASDAALIGPNRKIAIVLQDMGNGFGFLGAPPPPSYDAESDILRNEKKSIIIGAVVVFPICFWLMLCLVARQQIYDAPQPDDKSLHLSHRAGRPAGGRAPDLLQALETDGPDSLGPRRLAHTTRFRWYPA